MAKTHSERRHERNESLCTAVSDEAVGALVSEVFEDEGRDTTWEDVVSTLVTAEARSTWGALPPEQQVAQVLSAAADYDERAADRLAGVPTDRSKPTPEICDEFVEAIRCRRKADWFRDGVAHAYDSGVVADEEIVAAVEEAEFDAAIIGEREDELERVANAYDFDFRPYGTRALDGGE